MTSLNLEMALSMASRSFERRSRIIDPDGRANRALFQQVSLSLIVAESLFFVESPYITFSVLANYWDEASAPRL